MTLQPKRKKSSKEYQTCFYLNLRKNGYDISHMKFDKIPMSFKKFAECIDDMFKNIEKIMILMWKQAWR